MDGLLPRWHINFNITMLRIVSFALDYHWRQTGSAQTVSLTDFISAPSLPIGSRGLPQKSVDITSRERVLAAQLYRILLVPASIHRWADHDIQRLHMAGALQGQAIAKPRFAGQRRSHAEISSHMPSVSSAAC